MARRKVPMHQMNVVPYIDVMLVLLIIFMITAPLVQTTYIDLPKSSTSAPDTTEIKPVIIQMIAKDVFEIGFADKDKLTTTQQLLANTVSAIIKENNLTAPQIYLAASATSLYGDVIEIADYLREIPDVKVSLLLEKK